MNTSIPVRDWWADGHLVHADSAHGARQAVHHLYGHDAETVRPWTTEDDQEGIR